MEPEDLSEAVEWEARRIAAAFGVERFTASRYNATLTDFHASCGRLTLWWSLDSRYTQSMIRVLDIQGEVQGQNQRCQVAVSNILGEVVLPDRWRLLEQGVFREEMARWLYRLGFQDEDILSKLPALTMHEKMELRLSLPREFWPRKWLAEENAAK